MKKITLGMLLVFTTVLHAQTKLLSSINQYYNGSSWENNWGSNYDYDGNSNLITETYFSWDIASSIWENSGKTSFTYNSSNKATEELDLSWNGITNVFENNYRILYSYNSNGNVIEILDQEWDGSQWVNEYKTVVTYNGSDLIDMGISYNWSGSQWVNDYRSTLTYNANNKIISSNDEEWVSDSWVNSYRVFLAYNGNNKIMTSIGEDWNGSSWENAYTQNYNYDANGNTINYTDSYGGVQYKSEYSFDLAALMTNFEHPFKDKTGLDYFLDEMPYVNKILNETDFIYDNSSSSYLNNHRTVYNYTSSITLSVKNFEITKNNLKIFPNPANNFIQISGLTETEPYEVYNALGAKVSNGIIANNQKKDIKNLANGLYFLKFTDGRTVKFMKEL
ncbi:T9SS type A sorting domain-containing protein [Mariniflexile soesokkakense]|uniref:T9SS type A sorting domain-containing protein n=1 Tax=Mariniflexile soesokkakense TaxID=1343160 RepID=A0ABV0A7I4_9FLAO